MSRKMPTKKKILEYWKNDTSVNRHWIDWIECGSFDVAETICFACGCNIGVERAHMTAKVNGGKDYADNLHLLCKHCHLESEFFEGEIYDKWFVWKTPQTSGSWQMLENKTAFVMSLGELERDRILGQHLHTSS